MASAAVYFKSRQQAGEVAAQIFANYTGRETCIISLDTDSLIIAANISQRIKSPLQLYLSEQIVAPGGLHVGAVNQHGGFSYASDKSEGETDYLYQEFHSYIDDAKRAAFSTINRELGSHTTIRPELIRDKHIIAVADCMNSTTNLDSLLAYLKTIHYKSVSVCAPVVTSNIISTLKQRADYVYFAGTVDFFYGKDHYFEDNSVYDRALAISTVSNTLKLWPTPAN